MDARALPIGYTEWAAPAALRDAVACMWAQVTTPGADRAGLVLPDGCTDLVWEQGRGAFVAGPDTGPVRTTMTAGTVVLGIRFRPAAGGPALGIPLSELRDQASTWPTCGPATPAGCPPRSTRTQPQPRLWTWRLPWSPTARQIPL